MKIRELLEGITEAPLPADWDKQVFTPNTSYKKRIDYAVARAQKLGKGSSRSAFDINFDGRATVLKVAHNAKGMAQNEAEAGILDDGYASQLGIMIPLIDYDTEHTQPVWIHTEKATKVTKKQLCNIMRCGELYYLVDAANNMLGKKTFYSNLDEKILQLYGEDGLEIFHDYAQRLADLSGSFDVNLNDFDRAANWGLYQGQPVVIDVGFTDDVHKQYYNRGR